MKKRNLIILIVAVLCLLLLIPKVVSKNNDNKTSYVNKWEYEKISPEEAMEMIKTNSVLILDVRTQEEYSSGHIPGSISLPLDNLDDIKGLDIQDTDPILIYCRSGNRSETAAKKLIDMGYRNVYDFGGINDWPYDIE